MKALTTEYIDKSGLLCTVLFENITFSVRHYINDKAAPNKSFEFSWASPALKDSNTLLYSRIKQRCKADMKTKMKMIYWKGKKFWVGKLLEHPEIMTQGETLEELEENLRDAYLLMTMDEVPEEHQIKELALTV